MATNKCSDSFLRPMRGVFGVFLRAFWYCCRQPSADKAHNPRESATLLLHDDRDDTETNVQPKGPLIAFSYAGMLWAYYLGVIAFLRDHFDLFESNISLSGISCGTSAVCVIFLDLSIEQGFDIGLEWQKKFDGRPLRFWFLSTSEIMRMIMDKLADFAIDDEVLVAKYKKFGGPHTLHFGVTALQWNWKRFWRYKTSHICLSNLGSVKQMCYAALWSMRALPFFRTWGFYGGYCVLDGALSSNYSIPDHYRMGDDDQVIRIAVLNNKHIPATIKPIANFKLNEWVTSGDLSDNLGRFNKGYYDAAQLLSVVNCIKKGLVWKYNADYRVIGEEQHKQAWNGHLDERVQEWNSKIRKYFE